MSVLAVAGWVLVAIGATMLITAVVRSHREGLAREPAPNLLGGMGLSWGQAQQVVRAAQGRVAVPVGRVELVRALAHAETQAPPVSVLGCLAVVLALVGVGAVTGVGVVALLWLVSAALVAQLPWQLRRRRRRAAVVLAALPPS